jgi:hypothetical protein
MSKPVKIPFPRRFIYIDVAANADGSAVSPISLIAVIKPEILEWLHDNNCTYEADGTQMWTNSVWNVDYEPYIMAPDETTAVAFRLIWASQ